MSVKYGCQLATPGNNNLSLTKRSPGVTTSSSSTPHVIAMVGLPARGKTYISKKLSRYLKWLGVNTRVFNLGQYRRKIEGYDKPKHDFFDPNNPEGVKVRRQVCEEALRDLCSWIDDGGEVDRIVISDEDLRCSQLLSRWLFLMLRTLPRSEESFSTNG